MPKESANTRPEMEDPHKPSTYTWEYASEYLIRPFGHFPDVLRQHGPDIGVKH